MKKLILYGMAGVLAMLLAQHPFDVQAMDSGMMSAGDYRGYDMGPGMMRNGDFQNFGMGPQCYDSDPHYRQNQTYLDREDAEKILENYFESRHNPNLKLGGIKDEGSLFEAELLTKDNSLVDKLIVEKNTGRMRSAY